MNAQSVWDRSRHAGGGTGGRSARRGFAHALGAMALIALLCVPARAERTLEQQAVIDAPVSDVWRLFTTSEGARSWMAPKAEVDLRVGGSYRTSYNAKSTLDDEHTIVNRILSYEPERMISIRNERAPAGLRHAELFRQAWTVIYFEPVGERKTRVRMVGLGYGEGPEWDELYNHFDTGNTYLLGLLQRTLNPGGVEDNTERIMSLLQSCARPGGTFVARDEEGAYVARQSFRHGPGGALYLDGWLGVQSDTRPYRTAVIYPAPASDGGGVRLLLLDNRGSVSHGEITLDPSGALLWDFITTPTEGEPVRARVRMTIAEDASHYGFATSRHDAEQGWVEGYTGRFQREAAGEWDRGGTD